MRAFIYLKLPLVVKIKRFMGNFHEIMHLSATLVLPPPHVSSCLFYSKY